MKVRNSRARERCALPR